MKKPPDEAIFEDMQEQFRERGYRRNPDGSYQTNEGRVFLESPTEDHRRAIYAKSKETRQHYFYKGVRDPATKEMAKRLSKDTDLDIDWGIYAPNEEDRPVLLYGICRGGPYDGKPIAHHKALMEVAMAAEVPGRALPAQVGVSLQHPDVVWKAYIWQPALEEWHWDDSERRSETLK